MSKLTDDQRVRGRHFRDAATASVREANTDPATSPTFLPPNFLAHYRHNCEKRQGRSTAIELKEVYLSSADPLPATTDTEPWPGDDGTFGYVYREGTCKGCGATARSPVGRLVLAADRPPLSEYTRSIRSSTK